MPRKGGVVYVGRKSNTGLVIIGILLLVFLGYIANQAGYLGPKLNISVGGGQVSPGPGPGVQYISGIVTSAVAGYDSLDITTSRAVGTAFTAAWYAYRRGWVLLGSGNGADLSITPEDQNTLYASVAIPSGQSYYIDYAKTQSMNSRVKTVEYKDITGDGIKDMVFTIDLTNIPYATSTGKYIMPGFNVYLFTYDSSAALTMNSAVSSIGTTKVTKFLQNYATISAEKKALSVYKVVVQVNTSDISKAVLKKLNISGIGYVDGTSFSQNVQTSQIQWTYTISNTGLFGADYIQRPANTLNYFDFTTAIEFTLATGDKINVELYIYYYDSAEGSHALSGTCLCSA
jgi:hypothetical protein